MIPAWLRVATNKAARMLQNHGRNFASTSHSCPGTRKSKRNKAATNSAQLAHTKSSPKTSHRGAKRVRNKLRKGDHKANLERLTFKAEREDERSGFQRLERAGEGVVVLKQDVRGAELKFAFDAELEEGQEDVDARAEVN